MQKYNNHILQLLHNIQTELVAESEQQLNQIAQKDPNLLSIIVSVIESQQIQQILKISACTYLNSCICDDVAKREVSQYVQILSGILLNPNIKPNYKRLLERSIVNIIDGLEEPFITEFRQLVFKLFKHERLRDAGYLLIGCFCVPENVDIQHIMYLTRNFMPQTLSRIVLPNTNQAMGFVAQYNQILKTWVVAWDRLYRQQKQIESQRKKAAKQKKQQKQQKEFTSPAQTTLLLQLCQLEHLSSVIFSIYSWMAQSPLYICTIPQLYQLNILKQQACELHQRALELSYKKNIESNIYNVTIRYMNNIINNLIFVAMSRDVLHKFECSDFVCGLLKVIRMVLVCKPCNFNQLWKGLLKQIIFPLMKPDTEQLTLFQQSPSDYLTLIEDCSQKQTYGILKSQACKLLQKIGDKSQQIDQNQFIYDFIINFGIDSIKNYFHVQANNVYDMNLVAFDVAIVAISVFSYRMDSHIKKLQQLRPIFAKQNVLKMQPYERTLCYFFLSYNYSQMYPNQNQGAHWIQLALQQNIKQSCTYVANDFIFNITDQYYSDFFLQAISNKILTNIIPSIWDAIQKLIKNQSKKISQGLMLQVIAKVYQRLNNQLIGISNSFKDQGEEDQNKEGNIKDTLNIIKLVNIIGVIAEDIEYCREYGAVREQVWKIVLIFDKATQLGFEGQIFEIIENLLKQQDTISQNSIQILPTILTKFSKDEYYQPYFYYILNEYIIKSSNPQCLSQIITSLISGIIYHTLNFGQSIKKIQRRLISSHLLLLMQNLLYLHSYNISNDKIVEISAVVMRYLPASMDEKVDCGVVLARALNVLVLCHMRVKTDCVWAYTQRYSTQVYFNYDIFVLISLVKKEALVEPDIVVVAQMIAIIVNAITGFRKKQKMQKNAKKIKAKYGKNNRLKLAIYKQFQQILKKISTPFESNKKLQTQLQQLLLKLSELSAQHYKKMISCIPTDIVQNLQQICQLDQYKMPNRRFIFKIKAPKAPEQIEKQQEDAENGMGSGQDNDDEDFKRKRMNMKKKGKNKNKVGVIDEEK